MLKACCAFGTDKGDKEDQDELSIMWSQAAGRREVLQKVWATCFCCRSGFNPGKASGDAFSG